VTNNSWKGKHSLGRTKEVRTLKSHREKEKKEEELAGS